ncbi:MAG: hypothetical protein KA791_15290 [Flavobacteriales bacterium]|nr:hypothetical protein [Flavobacteriales bacterium]
MSADTHATDQQHRKRPVLLTWLCVLSFLFGGIQFVSGVLNAFTSFPEWMFSTNKATFEEIQEEIGPEVEGADRLYTMSQQANIAGMERDLASAKSRGYLVMSAYTLSILGVWLMWNLRKVGFGLYAIASAGGWTGTFLLYGGEYSITSVVTIVKALVGLAFLVLYALHLKHMR